MGAALYEGCIVELDEIYRLMNLMSLRQRSLTVGDLQEFAESWATTEKYFARIVVRTTAIVETTLNRNVPEEFLAEMRNSINIVIEDLNLIEQLLRRFQNEPLSFLFPILFNKLGSLLPRLAIRLSNQRDTIEHLFVIHFSDNEARSIISFYFSFLASFDNPNVSLVMFTRWIKDLDVRFLFVKEFMPELTDWQHSRWAAEFQKEHSVIRKTIFERLSADIRFAQYGAMTARAPIANIYG